MRLWIAAAALFALTATGLATIPRVVEWEHYRSDIEAAIAKETGHRIVIEGPIDLALLPRPVLKVKDVTIVARDDGGGGVDFNLVSQQVDLRLSTGPLLTGKPVIDQLKLTRPTLALDHTTRDKLVSWPPPLDDWSNAFLHPDLRLITVTDGTIMLANEDESPPTRPRSVIRDLSLTIALTSANGPVEAAGLFKTDQHHFAIGATLGARSSVGSNSLKIEIDAKRGADQTTLLVFNGLIQRHDPSAGLVGRFDIQGPDLRQGLETLSFAAGSPSVYPSVAADQMFRVQGRLAAGKSRITTEDLRITLEGKLGSGNIDLRTAPKPELNIDLDLPTMRLADETALIDFVPLDLLSKFPTIPGAIDLHIRELIYRDQAIKRATIAITTDSGGRSRIERAKAILPGLLDVQFSGSIRPSAHGPRMVGDLTSIGEEIGETLQWLGMPLAGERQGFRGFSFDSKVNISNVEINLSAIDMRLDTTKIGGQASLRFSERLLLGLDLDVERLNLDLYAGNQPVSALSDTLKRHLAWLDMSIDARLQRLAWQDIRFDDALLVARAGRQQITVESFTIRTIGDTAANVSGSIDLDTDMIDLNGDLTSQFPTRVLRRLDTGRFLAGARLRPLAFVGSIKGRLDQADVNLRTDYDQGQWLMEGQAGWTEGRAHYDLTLKGMHPDQQTFVSHFGLAPLLPANDAMGPFEIEGRLRQEQNGRRVISGNTKFGPTGITGRLIREDATGDHEWNAQVSIGNPRHDSLAPWLALAGLRSANDWTLGSTLGRLPNLPLRTTWLNGSNGSLTLSSRGGLAGDGLQLSASLNQGFLYVDKIEAALWNGHATAELALERTRDQPSFSLAVQLDDVEADALSQWLGLRRTIEGPLDLTLEAATVGNTPYNLVKGLSGTFSLGMSQGMLNSVDIPVFRRALRDWFQEDGTTRRLSDDPLAMPLLDLKASGELKRGIMAISDGRLAFDPGFGGNAEASVDGTLDLLLWMAELNLNIRADNTNDTSPMPFKIVGPPLMPQGFIPSQ